MILRLAICLLLTSKLIGFASLHGQNPISSDPSNPAPIPSESDEQDDQGALLDMIQNNGRFLNIELPTLGGKQFWTDHRWWNGWRIQYNHTLDHWRLIDDRSIRRAWGSKEAMLEALEEAKQKNLDEAAKKTSDAQNSPSPPQDDVVILLHGLMRTSSSMRPIEIKLNEKYSATAKPLPQIIRFSYASTRAPITSHAEALRELVDNLPGKPRIRIAGHSLGNIVTRLAIAQWSTQGDPHGVLSRIERVVMLGPPNQGSSFAKRLSQLGLFETITGKSGMQLGPQWDGFQENLGIPPCPFAILAGDLSGSSIQNPLLDGPNDAVVTVDEAKLEGMSEFKTYPVLHSFLMQDPKCVEDAVDFLMQPTAPKRGEVPIACGN
jgi:pimeloyl-ACP methyl ester carboxylesterase